MADFDLKADITNLVNKFNRLVRTSKRSKSMNKRIIEDYLFLYALLDGLGIDDLKLDEIPLYDYLDTYLPAQASREIELIRYYCEPAVEAYKSAGFHYLRKVPQVRLSNKEGQTIVKEFLNKFCPESLKFYDELWDKNCFLFSKEFVNSQQADGLSYMMPSIDEYRFFVESGQLTNLSLVSTFIHEFIHLYSIKFLNDYRWEAKSNLKHGYFLEAPTLFSELCLYEYLTKHGYGNDYSVVANTNDYVSLHALRDMVYLDEMRKRGNSIEYRTDPIEIEGEDTDCEINRGIKDFEYVKGKNQVENCYLEYSISTLAAYQMLEQVKCGDRPTRVLHDMLLSQQYSRDMNNVIKEDYNYDFMKNEVEGKMKVLKKLYPHDSAFNRIKK